MQNRASGLYIKKVWRIVNKVPVVINDDFYPKPPDFEREIVKEFKDVLKKSEAENYRVQAAAAPQRISLNEILKDQINRIGEFTDVTEKEFGALIMKDKDGLVLDFIEIGKDRSVTIRPTRPLKEDEWILGTYHNHPISDKFSIPDIDSFLQHKWEEVMILRGAHKTLHVAIKTIHAKDTEISEEDMELDNVALADKYGFALYNGINPDSLQLRNSNLDTKDKVSTLDSIVNKLKGTKQVGLDVKKIKNETRLAPGNIKIDAMFDSAMNEISGAKKEYLG